MSEVMKKHKPFNFERWGRMRFRFRIGSFVFSFFFSKIHTVKGICSIVSKNEKDYWESRHIILIDFDTDDYGKIYNEIVNMQHDFHLGDIWILQTEHGFHAICVDIVTLREYLQILLATRYVDPLFIQMVMKRGEATLRYSKKRKSILPFQKISLDENWKYRVPLSVTMNPSLRSKSLIHARVFKIIYGIDFDTNVTEISELVKKVQYQTVDKEWEKRRG